MQQDAFGRCHPVVNILFYIGAIVLSAVVQHPVFLAAALVCGGAYYLLLAGKKAAGQMALLLPFAHKLTCIPLHYIEECAFCKHTCRFEI